MRNMTVLFITCVLALSCTAQSPQNPQATFFAEDSVNTSLKVIVDINATGSLCEKAKVSVFLQAPSESINPGTFFNEGDFYIVVSEKEQIVYGSYQFTNVTSNGTEWTIAAFKRKGAGEKWIGAGPGDGNIYRIDEGGKHTIIAKYQFMNIEEPEGGTGSLVEWSVPATKMETKGAPWITCRGDKILSIDANKKLTQLGYFDWRKIKTLDGKVMVILMTKSMAANAKWSGQYDGKMYIDP